MKKNHYNYTGGKVTQFRTSAQGGVVRFVGVPSNPPKALAFSLKAALRLGDYITQLGGGPVKARRTATNPRIL